VTTALQRYICHHRTRFNDINKYQGFPGAIQVFPAPDKTATLDNPLQQVKIGIPGSDGQTKLEQAAILTGNTAIQGLGNRLALDHDKSPSILTFASKPAAGKLANGFQA
jgi:hypothetical protein